MIFQFVRAPVVRLVCWRRFAARHRVFWAAWGEGGGRSMDIGC